MNKEPVQLLSLSQRAKALLVQPGDTLLVRRRNRDRAYLPGIQDKVKVRSLLPMTNSVNGISFLVEAEPGVCRQLDANWFNWE